VHGLHDGGEIGVHHDHARVRVANGVFELRRRVRDGERDGDPAGPPDPPLDRYVVKARRSEKGDSGLREVVAPGEQAPGDAR